MLAVGTRNLSGDEIVNVNFFTTTSSTTSTQCTPEATEFGEIMQKQGHYAIQGFHLHNVNACREMSVLLDGQRIKYEHQPMAKLKNRNNLLMKLAGSSWGADALQTLSGHPH